MKANKLHVVAALLLALFFLLHFGGEVFFALGRDKVPALALPNLKWGMRLFPLSGRFASEAGYSLLEKGTRDNDTGAVKESLAYFRVAAKANPLDYRSSYYLAQAYLKLSAAAGEYFDMAVTELKRAAYIRGSNSQIALDCGKVFFSIWPLLEESDQRFAAGLLADAMPLISWADFFNLLEMWSLYVQDAPLLMSLLSRRPDFFGPSANQLVKAGIPLAWRWQLLDLFEMHTLDANERLYNERNLNNEMGGEQALQMLQHLDIRGYFRLQPGSRFDPQKLSRLRRQLLLQAISWLLDERQAQQEANAALRLRQHILTYIDDHSELTHLDELQALLEEKEYFKSNDFPSLYIKTLIAYKKGAYGGIITEIEALRRSISFVKKEQLTDYTNILLLLVDSYYSSKLLTAAEAVARELYLEQPDNPDILFRVLRVRNILGTEGPADEVLERKLETVQASRFLRVAKWHEAHAAYLFNQPVIEVVLDPSLLAAAQPKGLLQVLVDGKIAFESYVEAVPEKMVLGPPFIAAERKVKVQVNIL